MKMINSEVMTALLKINSVFANAINKDSVPIWIEALTPYEDSEVNKAIDTYIHSKPFPPKPADIIRLLPERKNTYISNGYKRDNLEEIRTVDQYGNEVIKRYRTYKCLDCSDTGLITWRDKEGCLFGKPCKCELGKICYPKAYQEYYEGVMQ